MASININRNNDDQFYRYKMPSLIAKVEGKGNGIKTVVVNMVEIAKALQRPPSYPCKYFGCELGAQTQMDPKNSRYIVNGDHEGSKLQELLDGFIKNFVLCEQCDNPETLLSVVKGRIRQQCQACGFGKIIPSQHKLTTFILKNPPSEEHSAATLTGKKDGKKTRGKKGKKGKDQGPPSPSATSNNTGQHNSDEDFEHNGEDMNNKSVNGVHTNDTKVDNNSDDEDWSMDTSKEAVKARMGVLTDTVNALALTDDLEKTPQERLDLFFKFVDNIKKEGGIPSIARSLQKVKAEAERLDVMDTAAGIMAEHIYTGNLMSEVVQYRSIMLHFVINNKKAQKTLLGAFEILVGKVYPSLVNKTPHILKSFYDNDILEEDVILDWNDKITKKHVSREKAKEIREKAKPIIDWLRTAEEESSEEEEDVEVVYTTEAPSKLTVALPSTKQPTTITANTAATTGSDKGNDEAEDDLNIDDI